MCWEGWGAPTSQPVGKGGTGPSDYNTQVVSVHASLLFHAPAHWELVQWEGALSMEPVKG